jgi:hypothetical protein
MRRLFLLIYGLSGAAGLIYEILWTRQLTLLMGHTTAAVSTVLAAFMGGLAIGAALGGRIARSRDLGKRCCSIQIPRARSQHLPTRSNGSGREAARLESARGCANFKLRTSNFKLKTAHCVSIAGEHFLGTPLPITDYQLPMKFTFHQSPPAIWRPDPNTGNSWEWR